MAYSEEYRVFAGSSSQELTKGICEFLGQPMGEVTVENFKDGEIRVQIGENIRGRDVFIVTSTSPPVNDHLMELLIMIDAAKRASAARITAVLPYFGYARQDRKDRPRVAITAKLVSNLIVAAGANRVLTADLHCDQIQGFFDVPVDHLSGDLIFTEYLQNQHDESFVVVSPDMGSVRRARAIATKLKVPLAIVDKRRPRANESEVMHIIGDVIGKKTLIFDDMIDTAGTLVQAAEAIHKGGAREVIACATHAVFSGNAVQRIDESVLTEVLVTDTIPLREDAKNCSKIKILSFALVFGEAIRRIHEERSLNSLFIRGIGSILNHGTPES